MQSSPCKFEKTVSNILIRVRENNLVELHYPKEVDIDIDTAKHIDALILEQTKEKEFNLLINFENSYGSMPNDVQRFFAREAPSIPYINKSGIVLNNLPVRLLVKFYLKFFRPLYDTRIFPDVQSAVKWLTRHVPEYEMEEH